MNTNDVRAKQESAQRTNSATSHDWSPFRAPFYYDDLAGLIVDADSHTVIEIRGWGFLIGNGHGALGLSENKAADIQNRIAEQIVNHMNSAQGSAARAGETNTDTP